MATSINTILGHAERQCDLHGTRLTSKRRQVLVGLLESKKALSAYELADYCRDELGQRIPAMSVYRILEFLEGENLVHRLNLAKKYVVCSHIACDHKHETPQFLICKKCARVEEVTVKRSLITALGKTVDAAGYHLSSHQLELDCLCDACHRTGEDDAHAV